MSCTVVTALYPIRSKFSKDQYLEWASTFMRLEAPIVLFTEESLVHEFEIRRGDRPIHMITMPFEELDMWKKYEEKWREHHRMDPERDRHTPELYAIWAQKALFVEKAIQENPFGSSHFFWCDVGAFRNPYIDVRVLQSFPQIHYFQGDNILFQSIENIKEDEKLKKEDGIYGPMITNEWNECRLVGGLWGGTIQACIRWKQQYQTILERYFERGRFAGKDQVVMLSTYLEYPESAIIVQPTRFDIDIWFFLEYLLSDTDTRFEQNRTYDV